VFRSFFIWGRLVCSLPPLFPLLGLMFSQLSLVAMLEMVAVNFLISTSIVVNLFVV
jgi:hypothetical protein